MYRILIVDDSVCELNTIVKCINDYLVKNNIIAEIYAANSIKEIKFSNDYHAAFLDIEMPNINGFEIASMLKNKNSNIKIIFVTHLATLIYKAVHLFPLFDFIRKEYLQEEISNVLNKLFVVLAEENNSQSYNINNGTYFEIVHYKDIQYFEVVKNTLYCYTDTNTYSETKTLKVLLEQLPEDRFLKINKSLVINMEKVKRLETDSVIMENDQNLPLNKRKCSKLRNEILLYASNR